MSRFASASASVCWHAKGSAAWRGVASLAIGLALLGCGSSNDALKPRVDPDIVSIGVLLRTDRGPDGRDLVVVDRLVAEGPAELAGVKVGDGIWTIDGQDTRSLDLMEVFHRLKGPEGSDVVLGLGLDPGSLRVVSVERGEADPGRVTCLEGDCQNGRGVSVDAFGDRYEGGFVAGKPHGQGKLTSRAGQVHEGAFVEGSPHGPGERVLADGTKVSGVFAYGDLRGPGKVIFKPSGDVYEGPLQGLVMAGPGGKLVRGADTWIGTFAADALVDGEWQRAPGPDRRTCTRAVKASKVAATGVITYDPLDPAGRVRFEGTFGDDCVANGPGAMLYKNKRKPVRGRFANDLRAK